MPPFHKTLSPKYYFKLVEEQSQPAYPACDLLHAGLELSSGSQHSWEEAQRQVLHGR